MRKKKATRKSKKNMPITPTPVKLDKGLKDRLDKLSTTKDRSVHWMMKTAIEQYVTREEAVEKLKRETLKRWKEAEHGNVVSNASVLRWLETWGNESEDERPE